MPARRATACWSVLAALAAGAVIALGGCVEERTPRQLAYRGAPLKPSAPPTNAPGRSPASSAPVPMPDGPIASQAPSAGTIVSQVRVAIAPLGVVPFDGQVLPVVSPDGRFIAAQTGEAPSWPHLLGLDDPAGPPGSMVELYAITDQGVSRIDPVEPLPAGLMLGRTATTTGVLVEEPRTDGTRAIGELDWATGRLSWLAESNAVFAQAARFGEGSLALSRREPGTERVTLSLSDAAAPIRMGDDCRAAFPVPSSASDLLYAIASSSAGMELRAFRLPARDERTRQPYAISTAKLGANADPMLAYQAASGATGVGLLPGDVESPADLPPSDLLFFHPFSGRMAVFSPSTGRVTLLAPRTVAGAWMRDAASGVGVFLTTDKGLLHQRLTLEADGGWKVSPPVRVLDEPFVPRVTRDPKRPFILIGPVRGDPARLQLVAMRVAGAGE